MVQKVSGHFHVGYFHFVFFLLLHAPDQQQTGSAIGKGTHLNDMEHQEGGEIYPQHNLVKTFGEHAGQHAC